MTTNIVSSRRTARHERILAAAVVLLLVTWGSQYVLTHRDALVVWSCGGNTEFLTAYIKRFEVRTGQRVRYTAAPIQYLLDLVVTQGARPDVIVGRGGPGWKALQQAGHLSEGPTFFAIDPLVIAVTTGNPKAIKGLPDLGRPNVRVSQAPAAMRPKGKVPALLMEAVSAKWFPGLVERWENNAVVARECGRELITPIIDGRADAAIVPRSVAHYPKYRDRIEVVPIPAKHLLALKQGRPSLPQCAGVLCPSERKAHHEAAREFVTGLQSADDILDEIGYLTLDSREAHELNDLLKIGVPKDMPAWQVRLADLLTEYGIRREALRRYLKVIYTFGPNHFVPRALYHSAAIACEGGHLESARGMCEMILADYPPSEPEEFDSPVMDLARPPSPVSKQPYDHWIRRAQRFLIEHPPVSLAPTPLTPSEELLSHLFPLVVRDGDPPKNGTREFALGVHLLEASEIDCATRDLLKVVTLNYPSRYMDEAECLLGLCAGRRDLPDMARAQWRRTIRDFPGTAAAQAAEAELAALGPGTAAPEDHAMPPWEPRYDTHAQRGVTYGMRLFEHGLPLFTFKEMVKVLAGVYGDHGLDAEVRFRAGVAAQAAGANHAARRQWTVCCQLYAGSEWAEKARERLRTTKPRVGEALPPSPPAETRLAGAEPEKRPPAPGRRPTSGTAKRFFIAEEFRKSRLFAEDQIVLEYLKVVTVAAAPKGKADALMATATFRLAGVLRETGHQDAANAWYTKLMNAYPDSPWAETARKITMADASRKAAQSPNQ